jgi:hypothetical protein
MEMDSMLTRRPLSFRPLAFAVATAGATLALAAPANAAFTFDSFGTQGDATAGWINEPNAPPAASEQQSVSLFVNGSSASDFSDSALASFTGVEGPVPTTPPSFDFKTFSVGGSGGSVRLVVRFSDGGRGELRPLTLQAGVWTHVDGAVPDWESRGGSCGDSLGGHSYSQMLDCHPGAAVTRVDVINDSGWLYIGGFQVLVDNVSYGGVTVSSPPPPVLGETVGLARVSGQVIVRYPGRRRHGRIVRLQGSAPLPVKSVIDSRKGKVKLESSRGRGKKLQRGIFRNGIFRVKQPKGKGGLTDLILRGDLFGCSTQISGNAQASVLPRRRRLWGSGSGRFRTRGLYSSGSVRGTKWLTQDTCDGTLTVVVEGVVEVTDLSTGTTVAVKAGQRFFASAP